MRIREVVAEEKNDLLKILKATGVFKDFEIKVAREVIGESLSPASNYNSFSSINEENRNYIKLAMIGDFHSPGDQNIKYGKNLLS
jgi:hypothetical protein